jgi:tRNA A-37 threonylcarbamoyl transferase component Bud32
VDTESRARPTRENVRRPAWPSTADGRRPSGLDQFVRRQIRRGTWIAVIVFVVSTASLVLLHAATGRGAGIALVDDVHRFDRAMADVLGGGRVSRAAAGRLADLAVLGYRVLWIPGALVLAWFARWRTLAVYLGTISLVAAVAQLWAGQDQLARAVRLGVTGSKDVVALPAWPVVVVSAIVTATLFALVPGEWRRWGWAVAGTGIAVMAAVRVAVGLDAASSTIASAAVGASAVVLGFGLLAPESEFPAVHRHDVKAHLRLDGVRRERILAAVRDQLGVRATDLHPFRLDGSAGSTPCRLSVDGGPPDVLFGKLYATTHLRSDRWYKLARVLRYGRLEDEAPFSSVRRLAEHEDYMLRLLRDGGVRVPEPWGVVEVVPGREYLLVTELVPDSVEILESGVREAVVDDALAQVRLLWRAGAAHRDIKPSNVLARGEEVYLVDVSFGELRPSRWRQAVDLANMMLTVGLVAGPQQVVQRAARQFHLDELAEAFAATSSLTIPRQLRRLITSSGTDLVAEFRALLPPHPRIRVQRWSLRRVLLAAGTAGGLLAVTTLIALNLTAGGLL